MKAEANDTGTIATEARDRVIDILRHRLVESYWRAAHETRKYEKRALIVQSYAIATDLGVVISRLGSPGYSMDETKALPDQMPLTSGSVAVTRKWLGLDGDRLLGISAS